MNGKKGGPAHQAEAQRIYEDIEKRGLTAGREHPVHTPEGKKRYDWAYIGADALAWLEASGGKLIE